MRLRGLGFLLAFSKALLAMGWPGGREIARCRQERVVHRHSWNAPQRYTNWLLFNLQRHSDHAQARRHCQAQVHHEDSPQLPAGYATMFVLALPPPLWPRAMDHRVLTFGAGLNARAEKTAQDRAPAFTSGRAR